MRKLKTVHLSVLAFILLAIMPFFTGCMHVDQLQNKEEVYRESSPDNAYTLVVCQVGDPGWPYGPVKAEVRVQSAKGKTVDKESVLVYTDGTRLTKHHIEEVDWSEKTLTIDFWAESHTSCVLEWN